MKASHILVTALLLVTSVSCGKTDSSGSTLTNSEAPAPVEVKCNWDEYENIMSQIKTLEDSIRRQEKQVTNSAALNRDKTLLEQLRLQQRVSESKCEYEMMCD